MNKDIKEAIKFFKNNKKYDRILKEMAAKYKSREALGGTIELRNITEEERALLCKIDTKYIHGKDAKFTIRKFLKTFENTWIGQLDFQEVLLGYFGGEIKTNREIKESKALRKDEFFQDLIQKFKGTRAEGWLSEALAHKKYGYLLIAKEYEKQAVKLKQVLSEVMKAINTLEENPETLTRLAIFASNITKDPHFFDGGELGGKLLLSGLAYLAETKTPEKAEEESELFYTFGILKDEISNFTTVSSIDAYCEDGIHEGVKGFNDRVEPLQLNLWNLSRIEKIECKNNKIFVFENPAVFSEVLERTADLKPTLLCTSGQLKLASIVLLDKLIKKVDTIHYSGDFDPEGIKIAYRLKQRYGEKLVLWRYDVEEYEKIKSQVPFDDRRLKQISNIEEPKFKDLILQMKKDQMCGYQELLVEEYIEDVKRLLPK